MSRIQRDDIGLEDGPLAGIGYSVTTTDLPNDQRRYEWTYDCGCYFMKRRSISGCLLFDLSENYCSEHNRPELDNG